MTAVHLILLGICGLELFAIGYVLGCVYTLRNFRRGR